jgi:hypothetical protein
MSYEDGWAAMNLEMPKRVPRTEYSVEQHWELVKTVTGIDVNANSPEKIKQTAVRKFVGPNGWNFDFFWSTLISGSEFGEFHSSMGHAVYAVGGADYLETLFQ